uniref:Tenascin N n=1 Tax=Nothobranchius furzeri TaxID=105023 RepID=A0A8C6P003_NOTFU
AATTTCPLWRALSLVTLLCAASRCVSSTDSQPDHPNSQNGITFSHVYKIDTPGSSSCTTQDETGLQKDTTINGENDIVFKHNIMLQTPKCACEESDSFKKLLHRVNGLEEEVNYLITQCTQGCCGAGVDTSCTGHGTYQQATCSCLCYPGWEGPDCSLSSCPDECNDNGRCVDGKCVCHEGYTGEDCSLLASCPNNCNDKGQCVDGKCVCHEGYTGEDCSLLACPGNCDDKGRCVDGKCVCHEGYTGEDCSLLACPDCSLVFGPQSQRLVQVTDVSRLVGWESVRRAEYYVLTYHPKFAEGDIGIKYLYALAVIKKNRSEANLIEATTESTGLINDYIKQISYDHDPKTCRKRAGTGLQHQLFQLNRATHIDATTNLVTTEVTEDAVTVSWDQVQAEIDGYMLSYTSAEGSSPDIPVGRDSTSYRLVGLRPGVLHTVYIWAFKGDKVSRKISTIAETEMDSPKDLKASDVTLDSASLSWIPPLADIEGYILTYRDEDGKNEAVERQLGAGDRSFSLSNLEMGRRYVVTIIAYRGNKRSKIMETVFKTVGSLHPFPMDCAQVMKNGNKRSGIFTIYINNNRSKPAEVYCDMDTDGGGWLVLQRRNTGKLDFMKRWKQYIAGFGSLTEEFWLGLEKIHDLTNTPTQYELRFDLGLGSERTYAVYDNFKIAPVKQKFTLTIGKYRGTAGDAMTYHQGRPWTTVDSDNDIALGNCALTHRGAWWYKNCHLANLNGRWGDNRHSTGVNWEPWKGHRRSLDFTEMKIRPVGFRPSRKRRS